MITSYALADHPVLRMEFFTTFPINERYILHVMYFIIGTAIEQEVVVRVKAKQMILYI